MRREIFTGEHDAFRDMARSFIAREITPHWARWEQDKMVSRDAWLAAGRAGLLGIHVEERYGGGGNCDYRFYVIFNEELARAGANGPGFTVHNDMIGPYLDRLCTPEQKERWLPGYCSGERGPGPGGRGCPRSSGTGGRPRPVGWGEADAGLGAPDIAPGRPMRLVFQVADSTGVTQGTCSDVHKCGR